MPEIEHLRVYPVKGLDGAAVESVEVLSGGTLAYDREFALFDASDEVINGKRTDRVHDLSATYDLASRTVTLTPRTGEAVTLDLEEERAAAAEWFGEFFGTDLRLERDTDRGYVDRRSMGPSVVSTATLETVAGWFEDLTVEGVRRRLRANVEVSGVPAFWEDRFVGAGPSGFSVDGVRLEGVTPCGRCVVPQRDPDTGDALPGFRERFVRKREETFPEWADESAFDHYYTLMLIASVSESDRGATVAVGDSVSVPEE